MGDLDSFQERIVAFRDSRGWKRSHNPKDMAISLSLEAAELLEHFQWKSPAEVKQHLRNHSEDISDELIDVLYWVLLMAHDLRIDISKEFDRKMKKNAQKYPAQPPKH